MNSKIKILIIEDNRVLLDSYKEIINETKNFYTIGAYSNCEEAILNLKNDNPDIALIDIQLPGINGIEGLKKMKNIKSDLLSIIITVHNDTKYIFDALCAGAIGYLTKNTEPDELINALNEAYRGGAPMSALIARKVVESFVSPKEKDLSDRENSVLQLLAKGKSYASIGKELNVSINTIKTHTRNIYEKLQVNSKEEIIKKYNN
ncbi:DNA-binding NarL/FixJ family response regulator [Aquimarina sp. EL_43]|uniref:response regulator n=1 Tax=Aquimarina TaxID=290174 RepID=UPI0004BABA71|nr:MULTISPECIES: response regulator transcription factor [Aquimarina]MBG6132556.1 DNA-binding NarL/FixJ family response regulator [Aquimarina sp. EL_35]MBG6152687.1 DNA-binding NarL/FixJ family response regulator [Aquimarina sp. EL_32]MBG6170694.1 DNA-binding NarL/FixJ family response regulator [Aquimarina sp. EL_43]